MNNGCKDCLNRTIGCHTNCEKYKNFQEKMRIINKNRKQYFGYMRDTNENWSYIRSRKK